MPIVDGLTSTKMIRTQEHSAEHGGHSALAAHNGRVPIFAVSASLIEREKNTYVEAGFDGWILKPVDFKRLNTLLLGIVDDEVRTSCLYRAGEWERGGWFPRSEKLSSTTKRDATESVDETLGPQLGTNADTLDKSLSPEPYLSSGKSAEDARAEAEAEAEADMETPKA